MANVNDIEHDHIVKCVAAIRKGDNRYFMFPWADGDSLRDYWNTASWRPPTRESMLEAICQLRGLTDALVTLHDGIRTHMNRNAEEPDGDTHELTVRICDENGDFTDHYETTNPNNIRHGDLKPENILRFLNQQEGLGMLKLADMGLAKQHIVVTSDRQHLTDTRYGTVRYEAPEAVSNPRAPRSRLYDIWSMGCITLEFIIWILYGNDELGNFYTQVQGGDEQQLCQFFEMLGIGHVRRAEIHPTVLEWMNHVENFDPECLRKATATKDLIRIIREQLLVVPLPPNRASSTLGGRGFAPPQLGQTTTRYRATAVQLRDALDKILAKRDEPGYLFGTEDRSDIQLPSSHAGMPPPFTAQERGSGAAVRSLEAQHYPANGTETNTSDGQIRPADYTLPPMRNWQFSVDTPFAEALCNELGPEAMQPTGNTRTRLCNRCQALDFWISSFTMRDRLSALTQRAKICDFCKLLSIVCKGNQAIRNDRLQVERRQSRLMVTGDPYPVLSIIRSPGRFLTFCLVELRVICLVTGERYLTDISNQT